MKIATLILIVVLLVASNFYTYVYFTGLNGYLKFTLQQIAMQKSQKLGEYSVLEYYMSALHESYFKIVEVNEQLEKISSNFHRDLSNIPYNYTIMPYDEFLGKFLFAYTDEMRSFVLNITGGWNGTDEDFRSDLYKIYREWRSMFKYVSPEGQEAPLSDVIFFINFGGFNFGRIEVYSLEEQRWITLDYLSELPFGYEIKPIEVSGASIVFRNKQGQCWDYAITLIALYHAYYDASGRDLPTIYLSIEGRDLHHGVVLIKLEGDKVAIIDWDIITPVNNGMIEFVPFEVAKRLHEEYWGRSLLYRGYMKGRPYKTGYFNSNEEFYKWLLNELK